MHLGPRPPASDQIRIVFPDQRERVVPERRLDPAIGQPSKTLVTHTRATIGHEPPQKSAGMLGAHRQQCSCRGNRPSFADHLGQSADAPHVALAHCHPAYCPPPGRHRSAVKLTFLSGPGITPKYDSLTIDHRPESRPGPAFLVRAFRRGTPVRGQTDPSMAPRAVSPGGVGVKTQSREAGRRTAALRPAYSGGMIARAFVVAGGRTAFVSSSDDFHTIDSGSVNTSAGVP